MVRISEGSECDLTMSSEYDLIYHQKGEWLLFQNRNEIVIKRFPVIIMHQKMIQNVNSDVLKLAIGLSKNI